MHVEPTSGVRRAVVITFSIAALIVLFLIGRRATTAAPIATMSSAPVADASTGDTSDASPPEAAPAPADAETGTPDVVEKLAVEQLADGGVVVDLNLATEGDLRKLPGVGPARAKKILELRARLGRFKSVDDLARIKGFGKTTLKRLRPMTRAGT